MNYIELVLIALSLSMDAFAVALCQGLSMKKIIFKRTLLIALFFGGFQALMPLLGSLLGAWFESYISSFAPYIGFALLSFIGIKMIIDACKKDSEQQECPANILKLLLLALATSIDALAVGITLPLLWGRPIWIAIVIIGCITFALSLVGVAIGNRFGVRFKKKAEVAGGIILIALGIKILVEHLIAVLV